MGMAGRTETTEQEHRKQQHNANQVSEHEKKQGKREKGGV